MTAMLNIPSKTRLANLNDKHDAAITYAIVAMTQRVSDHLSIDRALRIAQDADAERATLTIEEAIQDAAEWAQSK